MTDIVNALCNLEEWIGIAHYNGWSWADLFDHFHMDA